MNEYGALVEWYWQENGSARRKICLSPFLSTWTRLVLNPGLCDEGLITCCFLNYKFGMVRINVTEHIGLISDWKNEHYFCNCHTQWRLIVQKVLWHLKN